MIVHFNRKKGPGRILPGPKRDPKSRADFQSAADFQVSVTFAMFSSLLRLKCRMI